MKRTAVVVPCYNEEARLDRDAFVSAIESSPDLTLLFVDDGSVDDTADLLRTIADELGTERATVLELATNVGKAEAVRAGINHAMREIDASGSPTVVGYWDADLSTSLEELSRFQAVLDERPETLAVIGSRVRLAGRRVERNAIRHYAGRVFATCAALTLGFAVYDTQCGGKIFRVTPEVRAVFGRPFKTRWAFDVELLARLVSELGSSAENGDPIVEVPLEKWTDVSGSKVRFRDLPRMLVDLCRVYAEYRS